ncbi:HEAT repeat domain-containing protein [Sulfidibacter corallicola]|uniref:HEAT repeat domain-containing protein n=1 Tax=Sulfidibacter corallicola TaxID=2818388 RepID=A0A8A4TMK0_SULCO|nr:HEAT repeat domain-containing protein [Sulfidibacter corallicola]QTD50332.1 HEAT repeat domain-containing protein [Sulfidibacter corallicola]
MTWLPIGVVLLLFGGFFLYIVLDFRRRGSSRDIAGTITKQLQDEGWCNSALEITAPKGFAAKLSVNHTTFTISLTSTASKKKTLPLRRIQPDEHQKPGIETGDAHFDRTFRFVGGDPSLIGLLDLASRRFMIEHRVDFHGKGIQVEVVPESELRKLKSDQVSATFERALQSAIELYAKLNRRADRSLGLVSNVFGDPSAGIRTISLRCLLDRYSREEIGKLEMEPPEPPLTWQAELLMIVQRKLAELPTLRQRMISAGPIPGGFYLDVVRSLEIDLRRKLWLDACENPHLAASAIRELKQIDDRICIPHLVALYHSGALQIEVLEGIGRTEDARVVGFLLELLESDVEKRAIAAAQVLGDTGSWETIEAMAVVREKVSADVAKAITAAIEKVRSRGQAGEAGWVSVAGSQESGGELSLAKSGELSIAEDDVHVPSERNGAKDLDKNSS